MDPEAEVVEVLRALADPIRLRIVQVLADGAAHFKGDEDWGCSVHKSTLSHHFKILEQAGITQTTIVGRQHTIRLRRADLESRFPGLIDAALRRPPLAPPAPEATSP
ncbi:ArsR/SmtB family transcription factor [Actinoplanes sp. NPDC049265]|uniref:ArsR/SmtB family transcription factor n=1 Tax=Actinoplanes sp. NPDC049265 TaxID=3363902 RepID=UPI003714ECB0